MEWTERDAPEPEREPEARAALPPPPRRPPTAIGAAAEEPPPESGGSRPRPAARVAGADAPDAPPWLRALGRRFDECLRTGERGSGAPADDERGEKPVDRHRDRAA